VTAPQPLAGAELCVHCGFCLPACPTYLTLDDENDSPRGRIVLMKALAAGELPRDDDAVARHLDQCLGCRGCETVCPSGVPYGRLIEETRARGTGRAPLPLSSRVVLFVFARGGLRAAAMWLARAARAAGITRLLARAPGRLGLAMATVESTRRPAVRASAVPPPPASTRATVAMFTGCVMEGLLTPVNRATERVLARNGYGLRAATGQQCCGALHVHAGARERARRLARANIAAFERSDAEFIAVNSAGCGAAMKEYGHLLQDDPAWAGRAAAIAARVRDVSELLAAAGPEPAALPAQRRAAVDHPCHLLHAQRLADPPARVLAAIGGLAASELPDAAQCCGSAGLYSFAEPALSQQILAPKLDAVAASGADVVLTANPGCLMHIGAGLVRRGNGVATRHPVELLDEAYRNEASRS
jgi:glycolate oxidase iron-sulfur subunit